MNKLNFTKFIMIIALVICPTMFYGQKSDNVKRVNYTDFENYVYASGDLGLGALAGDNSKFKVRLNGHLGLGYQFDNILGAKINLGFGGLNGGFDNYEIKKLNYFETNINLTINFLDIILGYNPDRKFNIVPHVGVGVIQYRVHTTDNNGNTVYKGGFKDNKDGNAQGYGIGKRRVAATIPMGLEVNYRINQRWTAFIDFTTNYTDTDRLDGIASNKHDWFSGVNLGATYRLGDKANIFRPAEGVCNYWFMTLDGGASFLAGDNDYNFKSVRGNANIGGGFNFRNNYRVYAKLGYGIYNGSSKYFNITYGDYYEINFNLAADLVGIIFGYNDTRRVALYPHIGVGQMQYKATAKYSNGTSAQVGYNNNSSINKKGNGIAGRRVALTVPVGIEFAYKINSTYEAYVDATATYANTDALDTYLSGRCKDWHSALNIGFRYKFNSSCYQTEEEQVPAITPEDVKEAVKEALKEQEAATAEAIKAAVAEMANAAAKNSDSVIYHNNFTNINFPISKSEKLATQTNIDAINRASEEMKDGSKVDRIVVEGYASPDGSKELNDRLAQERAEEAAELVKKELGTNVNIEINSKGADWDGLIKAIEGSNLEDKAEIANEIKNSSNREQTLRELMAEYPQIKELLPQLRRAGVTITTVK